MNIWGIAIIATAAIGVLAIGAAVLYQVVRRAVRDGLLEASAALGSAAPAYEAPAPRVALDHPSVVNGNTAGLAPVRSITSARTRVRAAR